MTLIVENEAKLTLFVVGDVINDKNRYRDAPNDLVPQIIGLRAIESPMNFVSALLLRRVCRMLSAALRKAHIPCRINGTTCNRRQSDDEASG